jgi:hypothetical protein
VELPSASLAVSTAISFALFAQPILVDARCPQLLAVVPSNRPQAGLAIFAAIALTSLAKPFLHLAGTPQFLALPAPAAAVVYANASRSNLHGLRECRNWNNQNSRHCSHRKCKRAHEILPVLVWRVANCEQPKIVPCVYRELHPH